VLTRSWRFDRMAAVRHPATGQVTAQLRRGREALRGVGGDLPAPGAGTARVSWRRPTNVAAQRWWRTLADDVTTEQAQASLDRWCALRAGAPDTLEKSW
jgi:hypothetical protein